MSKVGIQIRIDVDLLAEIDEAAKKAGRKLADEIVERLQWSMAKGAVRQPPAVKTETEPRKSRDYVDELEKISPGTATISVEEAGRLLGLSRTGIYAAARNGLIPAIRIGGRILVPKAALAKLLASAEAVEA